MVGESGLFTPEDIAYVQEAGVKAVSIENFISMLIKNFIHTTMMRLYLILKVTKLLMSKLNSLVTPVSMSLYNLDLIHIQFFIVSPF